MTSQYFRRTALLTMITIACGVAAADLANGGKPKPPPPPPPPAKYAIADLSNFSGSVFSEAYQINSLSPNGVVTIAGLTTNTTNSNGLVVGYWTIPNTLVPTNPTKTAYADAPGVGLSVLSTEDSFAAPRSVNNHGVVVDTRGVLRQVNPDGTVNTVGYLESNFDPWDINDQGVVAGIRDFQPAIAWLDENLVPISQTLPVLRGCTGGAALAINNLNQVVGYCVDPHGSSAYYRAFVWDPAGGVKAIGDFGGNYALALDINDRGQVVGLGLPKESSVTHAFLWENGKLSDLNTLAAAGPTRSLRSANGINNDGRIVGTMITNGDPCTRLPAVADAVAVAVAITLRVMSPDSNDRVSTTCK